MEENLELQETLTQKEIIIEEPSTNIESEIIEESYIEQPEDVVEESEMFQIWVDENGYYTDVNTDITVEVKEIPSISNIKELFLYKYNPETKLLELDETKLEQLKKEEFEELVNNKLQELSNKCQEAITNGIELNGEHFSYTLTDQNNISNTFQLAMSTGLSVPYHADGQDCRLYSKEEIMNIYFSQETNVTHHTTYYNQLKQYILTLTTEEEINTVQYGQELIGTYLETYNEIMKQASIIATAFASSTQTE
jgi:predicted nucleic acid-binding protein